MEYQANNNKYCETWEDFLEYLKRVKQWREAKIQESGGFVTELFFRGQHDSKFDLKTSLERYSGKTRYSIDEYYYKILKGSYEIENFIKENWKLPTPSCYSNLVKRSRTFTLHEHLFPLKYDVAASFLYLRHHGYPSPLLDWTMSHDKAAYFAFQKHHHPLKNVSIFIFLESLGECIDGVPGIHTLGPNVITHGRHFLQESQYTFCVEEESGKKFFASHTGAFRKRPADQQYIWKCDIPSTERKKVLKFLDSVNINKSSLFGPGERIMASKQECRSFLED